VSHRLRRFAAVGVLTTTIDVGLLLLLARVLAVPVIAADVVALTVAAAASFVLHRSITFGGDPHVRWVEMPVAFVATAVAAGAVDVFVLQLLVSATSWDDGAGLLLVKVPAMAAAALVRFASYRTILFTRIRDAQAEPRTRPPAPGSVRLSVVLPAYRCAAMVGDSLARLRTDLADLAADGGLELVVVDDGSGDGTADAARAGGADQVVVLPENRGKGAAVRAGMLAARGRTLVFTDIDLAYAPVNVAAICRGVEGGWDVVVGSRRHTDTTTLVRARRLREVGGRVINLCTHAVLLGQYRDTQCGLKGFRSDVAHLVFGRSRLDGFAFDVEVFHLVERYQLTLLEVPVSVENSGRTTVQVARDGLRLLRDLGRVRRWSGQGVYDPEPGELEALDATG